MKNQTMVPINSLPSELTYDQAVEAVYKADLDWIEGKLRSGLSVLVECDKQLSNYVYKALRNRFRATKGGPKLTLLSGHPQPGEENNPLQANMTLVQRLMSQLKAAIYGEADNQIITLTHLDILTTTTRSSLGVEAREAAAIMYENPDLVFLGFTDPTFEIPSVIEKVFTVKYQIVGISRDALPQLILQREARKFGVDQINPYTLYKYVSGLNAVRARQVFAQLEGRIDYDPAVPQSVDAIYRDIRKLTLVGDLDVPNVDLDRDIGGYTGVKDKIRTDILQLLAMKDKCTDAEQVKSIETIIPRGMIFEGPPGTGKTHFAKAIATALNATVSIVSGPELKSKWVGDSEANIRRVFDQARKSAPSIIIFDEIDSFATARGTYTGSGVEHSMINQLLTEMDGFRKEELVFIVATTNFAESLDPALLRPGRFELVIEIPYPDDADRREILSIYRKKFALDISDNVLDYMVAQTGSYVDATRGIRYSGDHLYALMRGLKREQMRRGVSFDVTCDDVDDVMKGRDRKKKGRKLEAEERKTVVYHEAGHAILAHVLPHSPGVDQVSVASHEDDGYLGYVMQDVSKNRHLKTQEALLDSICIALGGRAAEEMFLGTVSSGCWNDLQQATALASLMVEDLGMSNLGVRALKQDGGDQSVLRGMKLRTISDETAREVDLEISRILNTQAERARRVLMDNKKAYDALCARLNDVDTLNGKDLAEICK